MKNNFTTLVIILLSFLSQSIFAQGTWTDSFTSPSPGTGWYQNDQYSLSQNEGMLKIVTRKYSMWASFGVNIPVQDFRENPVVNLSLKTDQPFMLSVYLFSAAGNILVTQPVMVSGDFTLVSCDFSGLDTENKVLSAVNAIGFAFNGAALSWEGTVYFEDITAGSAAVKYAGIAALSDMNFYQGTTGHKVFVRGIKNATSLELTGADALLENITIEPVSSQGSTWLHFDCKAGADASLIAGLTAIGEAGFTNNTVQFRLDVEGNKAPSLDEIPNLQASVGNARLLNLSGISDGNGSVEQDLIFTVVSDNTLITGEPVVTYDQSSRYASLAFTPLTAGTAHISVTADDQSGGDRSITRNFSVEVLEAWNQPPTLAFIPGIEVLNDAGEQIIQLTGISDGDNDTQNLQLTASSSDPTIIPDPLITYTGGKTAELRYTPVSGMSGTVTISLTLTDDGGAPGNNGNQHLVSTFEIETYNSPLKGYIIPFNGETPDAFDAPQAGMRDYWHVEGLGVSQQASFVKDGDEDVFQLNCTGKGTWTGSWYYTPDMDLTDFPLMSMWVKSDQAIRVHIYFWDDSIRNNEDHHLEYALTANTWTKLEFDFSDPEGMLNSKGQLVNAKRITRVLFNYHPNYGWPFTNWTGNVQFKDIRIGELSGITPTYYCTINPVGQQSFYRGSELKTINLTGISRGKDKLANLQVSSTETLPGLTVSPVNNGEAIVSFSPSLSGNNTIQVSVSGDAIGGKIPVPTVINIPISVVDSTAVQVTYLTTNPLEKHQIYRGLGGMAPSSSLLDLYTNEYGASAIRFGIFDHNQIEILNDNEDPRVLDMSKLNYDAFDWDYLKNLKARGVETFLLTLWSPPAWMKENLSTNYQMAAAPPWESTINKVLTDMYDEYAEDVLAAVKMFKQEAGIELAGVGIQNEPAFCEPYASAVLSPEKFADMIVRVGKRFEEEGITTRLYGAEQVGGRMSDGPVYNHASYLEAFDETPETQKYSDIFAVHGYASDGIQPGVPPGSDGWASVFTAINANGKNRELWMTETEPAFSVWNDAFNNAANILTAFESGNVGLWTEWAWDGHFIDKGKPTQKLWAQSMFSFIRPGARRITSASGNNDVLMTSWVNDTEHGGKTVMILMNKGIEPLTVSIGQEDMPLKYTVYRCSENVERFRDNSFVKGDKLLLGPKSVVSLVSGVEGEPSLSPVPDQLVLIDAGQVILNLSDITDGYDVNQYPLSLDYSLSDNSVVTGVSLVYTSPGESGTFSFTPSQAGATEVTLSLTANGMVTLEKFNIIVRDYNPPTLDQITEDLIFRVEDGTASINLTGITDGGDGGQGLSVSAVITSSEPSGVLENLAVNYTSPSSTGEISFIPVLKGSVEITITVLDAGPEGKNTITRVLSMEVNSNVGVANSQRENVKLYPSPATDKVYLEFPENSFTKYTLYSADGMKLSGRMITGSKAEADVASLPGGYYLIVLEGKGKPEVLNFVK